MSQLLWLQAEGLQVDLWRPWRFVRRIDANKVHDLVGRCLGIEALGSRRTHLIYRRIYENLDELAIAHELAHHVARLYRVR